jgi:membrane-associated phospholipid phosphatase
MFQSLKGITVLFLLLSVNLPATAENSSNPLLEIARDQKVIWTAPFRVKQNWKWILPVAATTGFLISHDDPWFKDYMPSPDTVQRSKNISVLGSAPVTYAVAGGVYLLGKACHDNHLSRIGLVGLEALVDSTIVSYGLKLTTQRERPHTGDKDGSFFEGGSSFPSGHAIGVWSITTALLNAHRQPLLVQIAGYGLATLISASRVTGEKHYPSDVFAGSVMGFLIGRYVAGKGVLPDKLSLLPAMTRHGAGLNLVYQW